MVIRFLARTRCQPSPVLKTTPTNTLQICNSTIVGDALASWSISCFVGWNVWSGRFLYMSLLNHLAVVSLVQR